MTDTVATENRKSARPRFIWDYNLSDADVREILRETGLSPRKRWLIARILCEARFEEVFHYLDLKSIREAFPSLRLPPAVRSRWNYALDYWARHG